MTGYWLCENLRIIVHDLLFTFFSKHRKWKKMDSFQLVLLFVLLLFNSVLVVNDITVVLLLFVVV